MAQPQPRFSVLLLSYTRTDLLEARMAELDACLQAPPTFEVLVCDNGSPNRSASLLLSTIALGRPLRYPLRHFRVHPNIGFGPGFNRLLEEASGEVLVCLSDDVAVQGNFLPVVDDAIQQGAMPLLVAQDVIVHAAGWNVFGDETIPYPQGYFLAAKREVWELLGGFDGRFAPNDYEDVDLGMKAKQLGVTLLGLPQLPLVHKGAQTVGYSPDRMRQTVAMRATFAEKWGLANVPERP